MAWIKTNTGKDEEALIDISEIRCVTKEKSITGSPIYKCWFKNLQAYQSIAKSEYDKLVKYLAHTPAIPTDTDFLI